MAVIELSRLWEKIVFSSSFNMNGAICLDKNVRKVASSFTEFSNSAIRSLFARIFHISNCLNAESKQELNEMIDSNNSIIFSDIERKELLKLRVDLR